MQGGVDAGQAIGRVGHVAGDVVLAADRLVHEAGHERPGDRVGDRGDHSDPEGRQAGSQGTYGQDHPAAQPGDGGVTLHHFAVAEHVRPADVEGAVGGGREPFGGRGDQVTKHITDGDGLDAVAHPPRWFCGTTMVVKRTITAGDT